MALEPELRDQFNKLELQFVNDYDIALDSKRPLPWLYIIHSLLQDRICILTEDRGLLPPIGPCCLSLSSLARRSYTLSTEQVDRWEKICEKFSQFFPNVQVDVTLREGRMIDSAGDEQSITGMPEILFQEFSRSLDDEALENDRPERTFTIPDAPSGMYEVLMVLLALFELEATTVILDEPGKSLHPTKQSLLRKKIAKKTNRTVITITHSAEMISEATISNIRRIARNGRRETVILPRLHKPRSLKWACDPRVRSVFFSVGVLFVEGESDLRWMEAFSTCLRERMDKETAGEFFWEIIQLGGKSNTKHAMKVVKTLNIPYLILLDWDALLVSKKEGQPVYWREPTHWDVARNSVLHSLFPACAALNAAQPPKDEDIEAVRKQFLTDHHIFVWAEQLPDIERVTMVEKKEWNKLSFQQIQTKVKDLLALGEESVAFRQLLSALIERNGLKCTGQLLARIENMDSLGPTALAAHLKGEVLRLCDMATLVGRDALKKRISELSQQQEKVKRQATKEIDEEVDSMLGKLYRAIDGLQQTLRDLGKKEKEERMKEEGKRRKEKEGKNIPRKGEQERRRGKKKEEQNKDEKEEREEKRRNEKLRKEEEKKRKGKKKESKQEMMDVQQEERIETEEEEKNDEEKGRTKKRRKGNDEHGECEQEIKDV